MNQNNKIRRIKEKDFDNEMKRFSSLLNPFKEEINRLYEIFEMVDKRRPIEIQIVDKSAKLDSLYLAKFSVSWTKKEIYIYAYQKNILDFISFLEQEPENLKFNKLFKEIAQHEYGHILTSDSIEDYKYLKTMDEDFNNFVDIFNEFFAYKKVFELIESNPNRETIKSNIIIMNDALNNDLLPIIKNLFSFMELTMESFIFGVYDDIIETFQSFEGNLNLIGEVFRKMEQILKSITKITLNNSDLKKKLLNLLNWIRTIYK